MNGYKLTFHVTDTKSKREIPVEAWSLEEALAEGLRLLPGREFLSVSRIDVEQLGAVFGTLPRRGGPQ